MSMVLKSRPIRVLHLINTLSAGGAELHLLTLCRHQKSRGHEVAVAFLREQVRDSRSLRLDFEQEGIRLVNLQADGRYNWRFLAQAPMLQHRARFDILHTHLPRADLAGAMAKVFSPDLAWVCSVHGMYCSWSGSRALFAYKYLWRRADAVIAISRAVRDWLAQTQRLPAEKIAVIPYGLDPEPFFPSRSSSLQRPHGKAVIGSIGRLEPGKGHQTLIHAMPLILREVPGARLLIAGHDPDGYGQALQALIKQLGLEGRVALAGFQRDVPAFLHALDVFAFASSSEGFGQVLIEAMAAGKPVVASRIPPLTEIVREGETGLLAEVNAPEDFAQKILGLLLNPDRGRDMGKAGLHRVKEEFSAERMSQETATLYERLLAR